VEIGPAPMKALVDGSEEVRHAIGVLERVGLTALGVGEVGGVGECLGASCCISSSSSGLLTCWTSGLARIGILLNRALGISSPSHGDPLGGTTSSGDSILLPRSLLYGRPEA